MTGFAPAMGGEPAAPDPLERLTRFYLSDDRKPVIAFIVRGPAGWVDLVWTVEPGVVIGLDGSQLQAPVNNWGLTYARADKRHMGYTITGGKEFVQAFVDTGCDAAVFAALEDAYRTFDWSSEPEEGTRELPGRLAPLPEEVR